MSLTRFSFGKIGFFDTPIPPMKHRALFLTLPFLVCLFTSLVGAQSKAPTENPPSLLRLSEEVDEDERIRLLAEGDPPSVEWVLHKTEDNAHPDGNEQQMVWLMNRARTSPSDEGLFLADSGESRVDSAINFFGVDVDLMKSEFDLIAGRSPAAFDRRIYEGSKVHSDDLIDRDAQDHNDQFNRLDDSGFVATSANASVFSYAESGVHAHAAFNIDWGNDGGDGSGMQPGRGHRDGIMAESFNTTNVGIAMVEESNAATDVGPLVTSIVYAIANGFAADHYNRFLVGTVWEDANGNSLYDPGEGLSGVSVVPDRGEFFAVTADSGGWAIPATVAGSYTITFSGGDLSEPEERTALVEDASVLVSWNSTDSFLGIPPELAIVRIEKINTGGEVTWIAEPGHEYTVQVSTDLQNWIDDERAVTSDGGERSIVFTEEEITGALFVRIVSSLSE